MNREEQVTLRLRVKGREEVIAGLKGMGGEYAKMAREIENASKKGGSSLKAVNEVGKDLNKTFDEMAARAGPLGRALSALGPSGRAIAIGFGAATLALGASLKVAYDAVKAYAAIGDQADKLQVSTDALQALAAAGADVGVELPQIDSGLRTVTERLAELAKGEGELYGKLKETNPQLLAQLLAAKDLDQALAVLVKGLNETDNATLRNQIAFAAFGGAGQDMIRVLDEASGSFDALIEKQRETGRVVDEEVIRKSQEMSVVLGRAAGFVDRQLKQAFINLGPVLVGAVALFGGVLQVLNDIIGAVVNLDSRISAFAGGVVQEGALTFLNDEILKAEDEAQGYRDLIERIESGPATDANAEALAAARSLLDQAEQRLVELRAQEQRIISIASGGAPELPSSETPGLFGTAGAQGRLTGILAARSAPSNGGAGSAASERLRLEREAAKVLIEQNDISLALELKQRDLAALVKAKLIDEDQAAEALRQAREELIAMTPAAEALGAKFAAWYDQVQAAREEAERLADAAEREAAARTRAAQAAADQIAASVMTPEEIRAARLAELGDLRSRANRGEIEFDPEFEARAVREIEEAYERAREEASRFRDTQYEIEDALLGLIDGSVSFEEAWRQALRAFVFELFDVRDNVTSIAREIRKGLEGMFPTSSGGGWGISNLVSGALSLFNPGASAVAAHGGSTFLPVFHEGRAPGLDARAFRPSSARLSPDETLAVLRNDEMVGRPGQFGGNSFSFAFPVDARGADPAAVNRLMRELNSLKGFIQQLVASEPERMIGHLQNWRQQTGNI